MYAGEENYCHAVRAAFRQEITYVFFCAHSFLLDVGENGCFGCFICGHLLGSRQKICKEKMSGISAMWRFSEDFNVARFASVHRERFGAHSHRQHVIYNGVWQLNISEKIIHHNSWKFSFKNLGRY